MKDIVIIGCGITGSLIAHELSKYQLDIVVLEKNNDVALESTCPSILGQYFHKM